MKSPLCLTIDEGIKLGHVSLEWYPHKAHLTKYYRIHFFGRRIAARALGDGTTRYCRQVQGFNENALGDSAFILRQDHLRACRRPSRFVTIWFVPKVQVPPNTPLSHR